jgi:glyoxylase-like metal-dependent hydrolase (beta-lactamase superfamily II)
LARLKKYIGVRIILARKTADIIKNKTTFFQHTHATNKQLLKNSQSNERKILIPFKIILMHLMNMFFYSVKYPKDPDVIIDVPTEILINDETWRIFSSPGHSSDHISLYNEDKGVFFAGDNIFRVKTTWLGPPDSNLNDYIASLEYMRNLPNLKIILSSHGSPIENPEEKIKDTLNHRRRRTEQVRKIIQDRPEEGISVKELLKTLYPKRSKVNHSIARGWVALTLQYLEDCNQIKRKEGQSEIRFFPKQSTPSTHH